MQEEQKERQEKETTTSSTTRRIVRLNYNACVSLFNNLLYLLYYSILFYERSFIIQM